MRAVRERQLQHLMILVESAQRAGRSEREIVALVDRRLGEPEEPEDRDDEEPELVEIEDFELWDDDRDAWAE